MGFDYEQIDSIVNARSMAIVGASSAPMKFGTLFTASQLKVGFDGPLYLVNPKETEIMGRRAYPDLASLPEPPDVVYLTIPAHRSLEVLRQCADSGVKGVIMLASGFKEAGEEGRVLERQALSIAREGGFRILGPNCFGIYNPRNGITVLPGHDFTREPGDIAFISQSGGFSVHVARAGLSLGMRFSAVISYGNGADIDETDLMLYLARDPQTAVITGYLEGARRGSEFAEALEEAAEAKPVIIWKVGKGEASRRAVLSHTGSLAGSSEIWEGLLRQCGAIQVSGVEELLDAVTAVKVFGRGSSTRVLICGGGGGLGTYAGDIAEEESLEVPPLERSTEERLRATLAGAGASVGNPLDIGAPLIPLPAFRSAVKLAASNPSTDVMVFDMAINFAYDLAGEPGLELATDCLIEAKKESGRPLAVALYTRSFDEGDLLFEELIRKFRSKLTREGIAVFASMPRALRAIAGAGSRSPDLNT